MSTPTIGDILERSGDATLDTLPVVVKALRVAGTITPIYGDDQASDIKLKLEMNEPEVLEMTIGELLKDDKTKGYRATTWIMTISLALMALSAMSVNVYIAYTTQHILSWEEIILPFIGPLLVVWHERGITLKENRDMLNAIIGRAPSSTITESIATRIRNPISIKTEERLAKLEKDNEELMESYLDDEVKPPKLIDDEENVEKQKNKRTKAK